MATEIQFIITNSNRLDKQCAIQCPEYSRSFWQNIIADGYVCVDNCIIDDSNYKVKIGQVIQAQIPEPVPAIPEPKKMDLDIYFEDNDIIIINKPANLTVHPAPGHYDDTLVNGLLHHCLGSLSGIGGVQRPGIVHRLDKDTSGLMVVAKNDKSHQILSADFAYHRIERRYIALATGKFKSSNGTINTQIGRDSRNRQKQAVLTDGRGKQAITHYQVLGNLQGFTVCEFHLKTGRTHQVRVHSAYLGHPLVGDELYSRPIKIPKELDESTAQKILNIKRQALHSYYLQLRHPIHHKNMEFYGKLPPDLDFLSEYINPHFYLSK